MNNELFGREASKLVYPTSHSTTKKTNSFFSYPVSRFYKNTIIQFDRRLGHIPRTDKQVETETNLSRGSYNGYMSPKSKSKVRGYLSTWIDSFFSLPAHLKKKKFKKEYLTFVTLTLPYTQLQSDNWIKRNLLIPFIQTLKRDCGIINYFWRAESQKNGRIHFHLIVDRYIHHSDLRALWNRQLQFKFKFGKITTSYIELFETMWGHASPNSTDINKLACRSDPSAYLMKYMCKESGYRPIAGRIHGCSDRLRLVVAYERENDKIVNDIVSSLIVMPETEVYEADNFRIIKYKSGSLIGNPNYRILKRDMDVFFLDVMTFLYNDIPLNNEELDRLQSLVLDDEPEPLYMQMEIPYYWESLPSIYYGDD